ncbi:MAG TPA: cytochrome c [Casimicrobiaceae bacterium]
MKRFLATGLAVAALIGTLAACAKSSQSSSSAASAAPVAAVAQNGAEASDGGKVYQTNCASCHQARGQGLVGTFPALAGNPVVVGDPKTVIHILKFGLSGPLSIEGHKYNGMMPAWAQQLSDADIASVITYVRAAWGNKASAVTAADVSAVSQ